ncbi:MAG: tripartite tricarboxylate transporter TctB family protein [Sneathiella sp.]|nr:tripartite tricarboxylate transporter TctB family protein [Sneathiella sp.]
MRSLNTDTIVAICLLVLCGVFFKATFDIRDLGFESMGAEIWPRLILLFLFVFSSLYLFQSVKKGPSPEENRFSVRGFFQRYQNALYCYGIFLIFLVTLDFLGMLIGGVLFVFFTLTALGERSIKDHFIHGIIALLSVGAMWSIFTFGLNVFLPEGEILRVW